MFFALKKNPLSCFSSTTVEFYCREKGGKIGIKTIFFIILSDKGTRNTRSTSVSVKLQLFTLPELKTLE